jgi:hypothetical protein
MVLSLIITPAIQYYLTRNNKVLVKTAEPVEAR